MGACVSKKAEVQGEVPGKSGTTKAPSLAPGDVIGSDPPVHAPIPEGLLTWDEEARLKSVRELGLVCGKPDQRFEDIVRLMRTIFDVELAAVSLVESLEIRFFSKVGSDAGFCGAPRVAQAFCAWVILPYVPTMLIVENAAEDVRFKDTPIVHNPPYVKFYAGAPLISTESGHRYGALFLMDTQPRHFSAEQYALLGHFAEIITRELERDKVMRWQQQALLASKAEQQEMALRAMDCFSEAIVLCDTSAPGWPVLYVNAAWVEATGVSREAALGGAGFWNMFAGVEVDGTALAAGAEGGQAESLAQAAAGRGGVFRAHVAPLRVGAHAAAGALLCMEFKPSGTSEHLRDDIPHVGIPAFVGEVVGGDGGAEGAGAAAAAPPQYYFGILQRLPEGPAALPDGVAGGVAGAATAGSVSPPAPGTPVRLSSGGHDAATTPTDLGRAAGGPAGGAAALAPAAFQRYQSLLPSFHLMRPKGLDGLKMGPLIGRGAHGRCYRGLWHGGHVAVKILDCWVDAASASAACSPEGPGGELRTPALAEAVLSRSLRHPAIVTTFEYGVSTVEEMGEGGPAGRIHQQVWLLQSYCNRGTLFEGIERGLLRMQDGAPWLEAILATASEVAAAMFYLHSRGIMHGDLTPNNILLKAAVKDARRWAAQVADFGLSRAVAWGESFCTDAPGSATHQAPETLTEGTLSCASDVFSFGVILWEMWAGQRAWKGLSASQIVAAVKRGATLPLSEGMPSELQDLMQRCLNPDHLQRPSFAAIVRELIGGATE